MRPFGIKSPPFRSYEEAEEMIMSALPMYQRTGKSALPEQNLFRIGKFMEYLGNPHLDFRSIHIAGTNGKGSVSHMLAAVCQNNGYKTGLFTSPHLKSYRERIRLDGTMIEESFVLDWVNEHSQYLIGNQLSFFEMSVGLAASYFSGAGIDIAVFETGLGGRLDATNVLMPLFTIITHIGMDHQQYLGNTLMKIAGEKAGIIKEGVPVLLGNNLKPELFGVFEAAAERQKAPLLFAQPVLLERIGQTEDRTIYAFRDTEFTSSEEDIIALPTLAPYQQYNLNTAYHACVQLDRLGILSLDKDRNIGALEGFQEKTGFRGRYEIIHRDPLIILDSAHNIAGLEFYTDLFENKSVHLHLILALTKEKDADEFLSHLPKNATYYFCQPDVPRAMAAEELQKTAAKLGRKGEVWKHPKDAVNQLILNANKGDIGLILGSIFLVAEIV